MARVNPYLNFAGSCEEAFDFYKTVFGGEFSNVSRFSDVPADVPSADGDGHKIMHVALPIGEGQTLMGSDRPDSMGPTTVGDNVQVSIAPANEEEASRIFNGLSEGGQITMPYGKTFWGADFGMCTDRFGVHWMVNYDPNEQS